MGGIRLGNKSRIRLCVCLFRCLVHILKENTVRYSKIRPLRNQCQLDLCRHEVRYGCVREDDCFYAHSLIELKVWMMQHELGKTSSASLFSFFPVLFTAENNLYFI